LRRRKRGKIRKRGSAVDEFELFDIEEGDGLFVRLKEFKTRNKLKKDNKFRRKEEKRPSRRE